MVQSSPIKIWRKFQNRYRLIGSKCVHCGITSYPPVKSCIKCHQEDFEVYEYSPIGKLVTWTNVYAPNKGFEEYAPYIIGIIELSDGERLTTQIVNIDFKDLKYGMRLQACFRRIYVDGDKGIIHYGLKFGPIRNKIEEPDEHAKEIPIVELPAVIEEELPPEVVEELVKE